MEFFHLFGGPLGIFFILLMLFVLVREVLTWYWKLNKIVDLLEKIELNTRKALDYKHNDKKDDIAVG